MRPVADSTGSRQADYWLDVDDFLAGIDNPDTQAVATGTRITSILELAAWIADNEIYAEISGLLMATRSCRLEKLRFRIRKTCLKFQTNQRASVPNPNRGL